MSMLFRPGRGLSSLGMQRILILWLMLSAVAGAASAQQSPLAPPKQQVANFVDIAEKAGLTMKNVFGGVDTKKYIIETTGTGVAIFDYDNDGWPDIFFVNGTTLEDMKAGNRDRPIISTTTITTELSPMSRRKPGCSTPRDGDRASASAITTTTDGKTSTLPITARTGSTTTSTASSNW